MSIDTFGLPKRVLKWKITITVYARLTKYVYSENMWRSNVLLLQRTLCGLRDVGRIWFVAMVSELHKYGLTEVETDAFVYHGYGTFLLSHMDWFLIFARMQEDIHPLREYITQKFKIKDPGKRTRLLCIAMRCQHFNIVLLPQLVLIQRLMRTQCMIRCNQWEIQLIQDWR